MPEIIGTLHQIAWGNPYTEPPDGAPRVLAEFFTPGHATQTPASIRAFPHTLGGGYGLAVTHFTPPIRRQPPQILASIRQKRLRRRIERQAPMFADQLFAQELTRKPEYYQGLTDAHLEQARADEEHAYAARLAYLQAHALTLIVHAQEPPACGERARQILRELGTPHRK
jgi:hypothetical protein